MSTPKPGTSVPPPPTPAKRQGSSNYVVAVLCQRCNVIIADDEKGVQCPVCGFIFCETCGNTHECKTLNSEYLINIVRDIAEENYRFGYRRGSGDVLSYLRGLLLLSDEVSFGKGYIQDALIQALDYAESNGGAK